jgi:solute carrier family 25 thiamine pyrophosphate transporter 19
MKTITRNEGMTALWKGNIPAEILYVTYGGAQFYSYQTVQNLLDSHLLALPHVSHAFISGACAGGFATTITYPLDCLRTRFAAQGQERIYRSFSHSIAHVYRHEGLSGYFRGLSTALLQIVPNLGIFFGLYEPLRQLYADTSPLALSDWGSAVSGGTAGVVAKTAVFPLDLLRKRLQVQGVTREMYVHKNIPIYHGVLGAFRTIVAQEGVGGLFKGLTPGLVKAAPNSAITMFVYEHVMTFLSQY